jgi:uncharacterized protein YqgC (DUF456 family)
MKDRFNRFAVRFLIALLLGLASLLLHSWADVPLIGIFLPRWSSPWELSKLGYWPLLAALVLTARASGGLRATLGPALPCLCLTGPALFLLYWLLSGLEPSWGVYLLVWVAASAIATALSDRGTPNGVWAVLAAALGALYGVFSFCPPTFGPFLDPASAAAMATIPF